MVRLILCPPPENDGQAPIAEPIQTDPPFEVPQNANITGVPLGCKNTIQQHSLSPGHKSQSPRVDKATSSLGLKLFSWESAL